MSDDEPVIINHNDAQSPSPSPVPPEHAESDQDPMTTTTTTANNNNNNESLLSEPNDDTIPTARQIVSIGTADDAYAFTFHEEELNAILRKIPAGWKVSVVSVVGAFRTGKSFLLSWFLRYLETQCVGRNANNAAAATAASNNNDGDKKWYERVQTLNQHEGSFDWRGGKERNTTGMWMWSDPYFLPRGNNNKNNSDETMAVLLVDTQGMFDHETTVGLTAAIFGLSTLLSSYQIYNVDKRIQEDNLQQLALFSEYGRMALEAEAKANRDRDGMNDDAGGELNAAAAADTVAKRPPFQKIEFLIRDWQNFDTEDESDVSSMEDEMASYLQHVLAERSAHDLKETRHQISSCFEEISCYMMTHPGFAVIKNKYEGDVNKIEPLFLNLLDRYCRRVFDTNGENGDDDTTGSSAAASAPRLQPKTVRGRELSAVELGTYIKSYAQMFEQIGANFPKAETMLEATSKANNTNAVTVGEEMYKRFMEDVAGPQVQDYHRPEEMVLRHKEASAKALAAFDDMATFGSRRAIEEARDAVMKKIQKDFEVFTSLNDGRNPLLGFET